MQGQEFQVDLRILELGGCDIVLGVDWMTTVSPLTFEFNKLEVTLDMGNSKLTLRGIMEQGECKLMKGSKLQRLMQSKRGKIAELYSVHTWEWNG